MDYYLHNELVEICMLLILYQKPMSGLEMILALDEYVGIENCETSHYFSNLRGKGDSEIIYEDRNGERTAIYYITKQGKNRLAKFFKDLKMDI